MKYKHAVFLFSLFICACISILSPNTAGASYHFSNFRGIPPIHISANSSKIPRGLTPDQIKAIYRLPKSGGRGTIAIVGAYDDPSIETDLTTFSKQFNLPLCTTANGCFEKHTVGSKIGSNAGWSMETSLDVEWAHAIAPQAKILLVEASTPSGKHLLSAVDYAAQRTNVVSISMSWGGAEFPEETSLDSHFISSSGAVFFASSGDNGTGASWPASSPNVVGVGGTSLSLTPSGSLIKETAWSGSGGGISVYEKTPSYQSNYSIPKSLGMRAIPDVAYNADPKSGFSIVRKGLWYSVGGTSAGAPQWAAIASLGTRVTNENFYTDKSSTNNTTYFSDITSGSNGDCRYYCDARKHYDYITGLGTPLSINF